MRRFLAAACVLTVTQAAAADPQWTAGLVPGLCGAHSSDENGLCFYGAARTDVLFGRDRGSDFGIGPALELGTVNFDDLRMSAGASVLLPIAAYPLVITAGPQLVGGTDGKLGLSTRVFWGFREYNHGGSYGAASGLLFGLDTQFGPQSEQVWQLSAQIDAMWLALPALLLTSWARGPSD